MSTDNFDWHDDNSVVFPTSYGIAVYENTAGGITIRQESEDPHEPDTIISIPRDRLSHVIAALTRFED